MATIEINGNRVRYQLDGRPDAPALVLSHSLGASLDMWDVQMPALTPHFRVLRYDTRGFGGSQLTPGEYSAALLGRDVLALADALGIGEFSFCGLSMGGTIGQWLGLNAGARLRKLVLCNTAAKIGTAEIWSTRIATVLRDGLVEVAAGTMARWFTPEFIAAEPAQVERIHQQLLRCDPLGYVANCAVVRDADFRGQLGGIQLPLLCIAGTHDPTTTVADAESIVAEVANARLVALDTAHLSNIGAREAFDAALLEFLSE